MPRGEKEVKNVARKVEEPKVTLPQEEEKEKVLPEAGKEAMRVATDSTEIFQLMEARDEVQMMQEIMGVYSKEYVYDIPFKGEGGLIKCDSPKCPLAASKTKHTHVRGLSWSGIKEARRIFKAIDSSRLTKPELVEEDGKKYYECSGTVVDLRTGNSTTVFKRHPLLKKLRSGKFIKDEFAYEIAQSKCKRNGIAELLPQPLVRAWITDWLQGKKDFDPHRVLEMKEGQDYKVGKEEPKAKEAREEKPEKEERPVQTTDVPWKEGRYNPKGPPTEWQWKMLDLIHEAVGNEGWRAILDGVEVVLEKELTLEKADKIIRQKSKEKEETKQEELSLK